MVERYGPVQTETEEAVPDVIDSPAGSRVLRRPAEPPLLGWLRRDAESSVKFEGLAVPSQQRDLRLDFFAGSPCFSFLSIIFQKIF